MNKPRERESNPNWRGGRIVASNGYVLIRVGTDHPLADNRGYAYEHRLVAQEKMGRALAEGEVIHHIDGNKQNNDPSNLIIVSTHSEHMHLHEPWNKQDRELASCQCGCGGTVTRKVGEDRRYLTGHNRRGKKYPRISAATREAVIREVKGGATHKAVAEAHGLNQSTVTRIVNGRR